MTLIVLGLLLWWGAHLWKRVAPGPRALMGELGKGLVTVAVLASAGTNVIVMLPMVRPPRPMSTRRREPGGS